MTTTPTLTTSRLALRPLYMSDADRIQDLFPDPDILRYMTAAIPWPYPADGARTYLEHSLGEVAQGIRYAWAITERTELDGLLIGVIELFPYNPTDNRGFWLAKAYHGRGYMTEAVAAVNDFAFDVLGVEKLVLNNAEPNLPSHRLKEKSGAQILEIRESVPYVGGVFREVRWELTREQWHASRHKFAPDGNR